MAETEHREQHNHGSGTFVGGDVHGGIWHVFFPPYRKRNSQHPSKEYRFERGDDEGDDYEDLAAPLIFWFLFGGMMAMGALRGLMGWPISDGASPPGIFERIIGGLTCFYGFLASVAAFFARLAQVFELWSEQCTITAMQSHGRWVARPPALMASTTALFAAVAAAVAEVLASFFGWRSFGGEVSQRARTARLNAAANAKSARTAVRRAGGYGNSPGGST
jgi:hypothetical protein